MTITKLNFATLIDYQSINNSYYGNPNYTITLETADGERIYTRSSSDSSFCYALGNGWTGKQVAYTTTASGRVNYMKLAGEQ